MDRSEGKPAHWPEPRARIKGKMVDKVTVDAGWFKYQ